MNKNPKFAKLHAYKGLASRAVVISLLTIDDMASLKDGYLVFTKTNLPD